jgi:hypothetical protein
MGLFNDGRFATLREVVDHVLRLVESRAAPESKGCLLLSDHTVGSEESNGRSDRLSPVLSGTWWVNSGADFDPDSTVPVPAGGFVRRVARTPHYDGVKKSAKTPAVIALFGIAPVELQLVDPSQPTWRRL